MVHGDALSGLRTLPLETAQLVFADPPFNVGKRYGENNRDERADYYGWVEAWLDEAFRIAKPTGVVAVMTLTRHLEKLLPMMAARGVFVNLVAWRNVSAVHSKRSFWSTYQPVAVYGKSLDYKFNTYAERRPVGLTPGGFPVRWSSSRGYQGQMLDYWDDVRFVNAGNTAHPEAILKPGTRSKVHPCQMPEKFAARFVKFFTDPGDLVVDVFAGSGSMLVAAERLDRNALGFEVEEKFVELAERRLRKLRTLKRLTSAPESAILGQS